MVSISLLSSEEIILASASPSRAALLTGAGIQFQRIPAHIDEQEVKRSAAAEGSNAIDVAKILADMKALRISNQYPESLVVGADQMLECDGAWFDKPRNRDEAKISLQKLQGKTHKLLSSVCVARGNAVIWHHNAETKMTMRPLGDAFISKYLDAAGEKVCTSVGAYQLEGLGAHLFERIEGDYFTILGLSILPLLGFLRHHNAVAA